jgi:tRNA threonylcarbamoyladenosine biosynthesis protein TsaB
MTTQQHACPDYPGSYTLGMSTRAHDPCLLAIETATETVHLGLRCNGQQRIYTGPGGARASATLLPAVRGLLQEAAIAPRDLDAIAFGRGPGAFTGLRTACSVAQGLALGAGCPVIPVDTLLVVAEDARRAQGHTEIWAAQDARMGQLYAARYQHDGQRWLTLSAPALYDPEDFNALLRADPQAALAGNAPAALGGRLDGGGRAVLATAVPSAPALLALALAAWQRGEAIDAALALPLYVRDKVAQTTAERDALRRALT